MIINLVSLKKEIGQEDRLLLKPHIKVARFTDPASLRKRGRKDHPFCDPKLR